MCAVFLRLDACEVWNYYTEACETFAEQNLTIPLNWGDFVQKD